MRIFTLLQTNDNVQFGCQNLANNENLSLYLLQEQEQSIMTSGTVIDIISDMTDGVCFEIETDILIELIDKFIVDFKFGYVRHYEIGQFHQVLVKYSHFLNLEFQELRCPDLAKILYDRCNLHDQSDLYNKIKKLNKDNERFNYKNFMLNNFECQY